MMPFNPSRLKLARERRGLTLTALAAAIDMTPRILSMYENGHRDAPPPATLQAIAEALRFPVAFFQGDDLEDLDAGIVSFRSLKSLKAAQRNAALERVDRATFRVARPRPVGFARRGTRSGGGQLA